MTSYLFRYLGYILPKNYISSSYFKIYKITKINAKVFFVIFWIENVKNYFLTDTISIAKFHEKKWKN